MAVCQESQIMRLLQYTQAVVAYSWMAWEREETASGSRGRAAKAAVGRCATAHELVSGVGPGDRSSTDRASSE